MILEGRSPLPFTWNSAGLALPHAVAISTVILSLCKVVLALIVFIHVLRNKRDVGATVGWIGLVLIAPLIGSGLYAIFGINRVRRLARRLRPAREDGPSSNVTDAREETTERPLAALAFAGWRLTKRHRAAGNQFRVLENGDAAYPEMLDAVQHAKGTIALTSYILLDDKAGAPFIDALLAAHGRGVAVRVLLDGIGSGYFSSPAFSRLRSGGVPTAQFMHSPLPWRMPFLNLRSHRKILVLDGSTAFTGGMNISAANLVKEYPRRAVRDIHFNVVGPVVAQLMYVFADDWQFVMGEELRGSDWFPTLAPRTGVDARVITSGPDSDLEHIEYMILQAVACARTSIEIMTPYFLPSERVITALALAALRGIRVDVTVPQRGNHIVMDWAAHANSPPLLEAGVSIWQNPPPFDHSKLMVVDNVWCFIGSANWDTRSFRLNFEVNMEVCDVSLASVLSAIMKARRGPVLTQEALDARTSVAKMRDAGMRLLLPYL